MQIALALLIGLASGVLGGMFGVGGGILIVPGCIYLLAMSQKQAQGTSLMALLLPVGALAVWNYWKSGQVNIAFGLWIAAGFVLGGLAGSQIALSVDELLLRKIFAGFLMLVAVYLFFKR